MNTQHYRAWCFLHPNQNSAGIIVELLPDKVRLHAATGLDIEALGGSTAICGAKVFFRTS